MTRSHYRLLVDSGPERGTVYPLRGECVTIGRGPANTIQIVDARISREHVRFQWRNNHWWVQDTKSRNGTTVNSTPILDPVRLAPGDVLHVGNVRFVFQSEFTLAEPDESSGDRSVVRLRGGLSGLETSHRVEIEEANTSSFKAAPPGAAARLQSIYEVGRVIESILDLDEMLKQLMEIVVGALEPTHGVVLLTDAQRGGLVPRVIHRPAGSDEEIEISSSILHQALEERVGVLVSDSRRDERFSAADSVVGFLIHSALCVPLVSKGDTLGAIYLDIRDSQRRFQKNDLQWLVGVAAQAGLAITITTLHQEALNRRQRERDLEIARSIQMNLLPRSMPQVPGFRFAGLSRPAHMVGGDYYDVAALADGKVVLTIADVSGKGIPAAILVASVRSAVRVEARSLQHEDIVSVTKRLNEAVCEDTTSNMFVTMVLGLLDPAARKFEFCNAGHSHPIVRRADGSIESLRAGSCFLGIDPEMEIEKGTASLEPGSMLILYTDGVTDAHSPEGEAFGLERLTAFIKSWNGDNGDAFIADLDAAVLHHQRGAEAFDDFTVLVITSL
jgi:phosphoserine phosphatase RsbU/P